MRPAPRGYSSARLHDLKFTFTPAGADDSVHSKAPLPRGGCLRSAQTGRVFEPILFFLFQKEKNGFNLPRKERGLCKTGSANRAAIASEEASSIPFPPGRRKLHIRSLLLPSQIVTVSLGHNLAIWNFTTPHAILMMAVISLPTNTVKAKTSIRRKSRARLWSIEGVRGNHPKGFPGRLFLFLAARHGSFLSPNRERKEWGRKTPLALHFPPCVLQ